MPFSIDVGYHRWTLVAIYVAIAGVFVYGVLRPRSRREWRSAGVAQAWVIALYAEMYGLPLTMYVLSGWLGRSDLVEDHFLGHLWPVLLGLPDIWLVVFDVAGQVLIAIGALVALAGWRQIHRACREGRLATTGLYRRVRHPQYLGFFLFLAGSVLNWPTIPTLALLPVLWIVYLRLARAEEADALAAFGDEYRAYMARTGRFLPRFSAPSAPGAGGAASGTSSD